MPRVTNPLRMPSRISSSESASDSKNFSINTSSCSAEASTKALCHAKALGISSEGISSMMGVPPSAFHEYFFMTSTSINAWNSGPVCNGYWTGTHFFP